MIHILERMADSSSSSSWKWQCIGCSQKFRRDTVARIHIVRHLFYPKSDSRCPITKTAPTSGIIIAFPLTTLSPFYRADVRRRHIDDLKLKAEIEKRLERGPKSEQKTERETRTCPYSGVEGRSDLMETLSTPYHNGAMSKSPMGLRKGP